MFGIREKETGITALGALSTVAQTNVFDGVKEMLITSLSKAEKVAEIPAYMWSTGFQRLKTFARASKCERLVAYSDNAKVIQMFEKYGGDSSIRYLKMTV